MARPKLPNGTHRDTPVKTYWSPEEYADLRREAAQARLSLSSYIRHVMLGLKVTERTAA